MLCRRAGSGTPLVRPLGRLIGAIPPPIAGAMLAGVLLPLCLAPVKAVAEVPLLAVPVVLVWAVVGRLARPWQCRPRSSWRWWASS